MISVRVPSFFENVTYDKKTRAFRNLSEPSYPWQTWCCLTATASTSSPLRSRGRRHKQRASQQRRVCGLRISDPHTV